MKTKNTLLIIAISGILAACGSSSDQGTTPPSNTTTPPSGTTTPTTGGKTGGTTPTVTGFMVRDNSSGNETPQPYFKITEEGNKNIDIIKINGNDITLLPSSYQESGFYTTEKYKIISGRAYNNLRFGVHDKSGSWGLFAQGIPTTDMPTTKGDILYKGHAVGAVDGVSNFNIGNSTITVNFDNKTVSGTLDGWEDKTMPTLSFTNAAISGNSFSNNVVKGQFYGSAAAEVGGVLNTKVGTKAAAAAFGAKKQ